MVKERENIIHNGTFAPVRVGRPTRPEGTGVTPLSLKPCRGQRWRHPWGRVRVLGGGTDVVGEGLQNPRAGERYKIRKDKKPVTGAIGAEAGGMGVVAEEIDDHGIEGFLGVQVACVVGVREDDHRAAPSGGWPAGGQ